LVCVSAHAVIYSSMVSAKCCVQCSDCASCAQSGN